jgi:RNA polymerase sigma-70 factor (ECF subfamily)
VDSGDSASHAVSDPRMDRLTAPLLMPIPSWEPSTRCTQPVNTAEHDASSSTDAELLAEVAAGNLDAPLAELYQRHARELYFLGLRRLLDQGLAEELVQETFIRLWRRARRFNPTRGRVSDYLFTIAKSAALDLQRRTAAHPDFPTSAPDAVTEDSPEQRLLDRLTIRDALESLTAAHREVLTLTHAEGLTQRQIADRLDVPLGTVKTRLYHGLRAFRQALIDRSIEV